MNTQIHQWFEQSIPFEGIRACAIRHVDQSSSSKSWTEGFEELALEQSLRHVSDVFQVLQFNKIPRARLRWIFRNALLHCERRHDGACFGVFTPRDGQAFDQEGLNRMFAEFQAVSAKSTL
jgi:hypothetical protein